MSHEHAGDDLNPADGRDVATRFAAGVLRHGIERTVDDWNQRDDIIAVDRIEDHPTIVQIETTAATFQVDVLGGMRIADVTPGTGPTIVDPSPDDNPLRELFDDLGYQQDVLQALEDERAQTITRVMDIGRRYEAGALPAHHLKTGGDTVPIRARRDEAANLLDMARDVMALILIDDAISDLG